jgi:hypothetical protein
MAVKEVDETQWQSAQNVVRSVTEIMKDPKRAMRLLELQKEAEPNAVIPQVEARREAQEAVEGITKEFKELRAELQAEREKRDQDGKLEQFTKKYEAGRKILATNGYNEEGVKAVERLMEERGIADHEDALVIYERLHPPQQPIKSNNAAVSSFLAKARGEADGGDEIAKRLIASKGQDPWVLDRLIENVRREGQ